MIGFVISGIMRNKLKKYHFIVLVFSLILILINWVFIDVYISNHQMISQNESSDISIHFEISHIDSSRDDLIINDSTIKINKLLNGIKVIDDYVVIAKSCYMVHIWQPPKNSTPPVYI